MSNKKAARQGDRFRFSSELVQDVGKCLHEIEVEISVDGGTYLPLSTPSTWEEAWFYLQ